jgi:hypothetical protein
MQWKILFVIALLAVPGCRATAETQREEPQDGAAQATPDTLATFSRFARIWERHVEAESLEFREARSSQGWLDYADWAAKGGSRDALADYLDAVAIVESAESAESSESATLAYYINVHNAAVVDAIVQSIDDGDAIQAPDPDHSVTVAGTTTTLGELRERVATKAAYAQPRVYFGLLCVARGCHRAAASAPTEENLTSWLDNVERDFMQTTTKFEAESVATSAFFQLHRPAFERAHGSLESYFVQYLEREQAKLSHLQQLGGQEAKPAPSAHQQTIDALEAGKIDYRFESIDWSPPAEAFGATP